MTVSAALPVLECSLELGESFEGWRARLAAKRVPPVIAIAGSRGKTTVVRLLDGIFREAGLRTALWTNHGVELNGRRQTGELAPWSRALTRLTQGSLDVAVQELDWATVHAVGLPSSVYPVVAVTNFCVNSDSCLIRAETRRAYRALDRVRGAARPDGALVLNGEDFAVAGEDESRRSPTALVALSPDTPLVRSHLRDGGVAAWSQENQLWVGRAGENVRVGGIRALRYALNGAVGFQIHNSLTAAAVASICGIAPTTIETGLGSFAVSSKLMPGSFNVLPVGEATAVVDRPAPSWFLRPALRALAHLPARRLLTVAGKMLAVPDEDLVETGRLLGRGGGALILHGAAEHADRAARLRQGITGNEVPPVAMQAASERQAVRRALDLLRPGDLVFVLADEPASVLRALDRARSSPSAI